ncbi:FRG domain-containing protein [Aeromonas veronii]|uniref:FRG domain-containing protein n=1 Tax=Aeromonas veronii TaxID=654 RepID=UPI001FD1AEBB|nr:FRG domain-containing protein [Aeromonas veronii]MCJ7975296.1 FRG domain-containing protein [Aeromonas veronii]UOR19215.1 FRG domain-containing protein [Aeromonas veronii]
MFNLLITSVDGAWDEPSYTFSKSRFLEYTKNELVEKFRTLSSQSITEIKSYPCLFMYERNVDNGHVGYITTIEVNDKNVTVHYQLLFSVDKEKLNINSLQSSLGLGDYESYRTHWAIKEHDLLETLKEYDVDVIKFIPKPPDSKKIDIAPPPPIEISISSLQDYLELILKEDTSTFKTFYRGHANKSKYKLEPSISRANIDGIYEYKEYENILFTELLVEYPNDFSGDATTLDKLVRMQHFALPTRLLDITSNPLVALYFACESISDKNNANVDGEVIIFRVEQSSIKYFDSDTICCLSNLVRLSEIEKSKLDGHINKYKLNDDEIALYESGEGSADIERKILEFNDTPEIKKLLHFVKEDKPYFLNRILPNHLSSFFCVKGKKSNQRIVSQSGSFLIFGTETKIPYSGLPKMEIQYITIKNKDEIHKQLDKININESTMYPDIENAAKYMKKKYSASSGNIK